ncbi:MAG: metallopeptidase family protein [Proteobacteria bacterium]|nr:MAG: metallopeptidase family protein [Pseudomonadota bacterium]
MGCPKPWQPTTKPSSIRPAKFRVIRQGQAITPEAREEFDRLLEAVIAVLPDYVAKQLEEVPVIVEDEPKPELRREMGESDLSEPSDLCGLQSGVPITERADFSFAAPSPLIMIFRGPIFRLAGPSASRLRKQIRITLLHEIGHLFGFSEDELHAIGYG